METTTLNADTLDSNNRMLGDNYQPKTIEVQDQAVDVKTTNDMKETQFTTQGETITTNLIEEYSTTISTPYKETTGSVDITSVDIPTTTNVETTEGVEIPTTTYVEIITTAGVEIPTTVQSELTISMNNNEDTTKEDNDNTVTDQTTTIQDDGTDLETDKYDYITEDSDNLLLKTLFKGQEKGKPANYNRMNDIFEKFGSGEKENEEDDEDSNTVDIKKRKYNIKKPEIQKKEENKENEEDNEEDVDEDAEVAGDFGNFDDEADDFDDYDYDDQDDYVHTGQMFLMILIFCIITSQFR